jgi:Ca2+-binding RTX toxin-like protein
VLALAVAAWAGPVEQVHRGSLIKGTNGPDVLHGTPRNDILEGLDGADRLIGLGGADRLYAAAGNDSLSGGAGADKLMGGPGRDLIRCGRGKDVVYADTPDRVAGDCEVVHRRSSQPSDSLAAPGVYVGSSVRLQVQPDGRTIVNLRLGYEGECPPGGSSQIAVSNTGPWTIQSNRTFAIDDQSGTVRLTLAGSFEGDSVSGTFDLRTTECDTGSVAWSAKRQ